MTSTTQQAADATTTMRRLPRVMDGPAQTIPPADPFPENLPSTTERNPMFEMMVENETDVIGLLAYGLYKQNKRDWLIAFQVRENRMPSTDELAAFILGERIARRVATYRRLAEDMLSKGDHRPGLLDGLMAQPANDATRAPAALAAAARKPITWKYIAFLLAMLVVMAILFRLAAGWLFGTR